MNVPASKQRPRLSRSEALIVAGLVLLLASTIGPGLWAWQRHQRLLMVRADLRVLVDAVQRYHREYGTWPGSLGNPSEDVRFGRAISNAQVMNILRAEDGPGNPQHMANEQQIVFLEVEPYEKGVSGLDADGAFLDAWGTPYQMVFDANFDNACTIDQSIYGRLIGQSHAIWSCGPDRRSDTPDDLLTWTVH